jgi:outer membrane protein assembly factor BamB
MKQGWPIEVLPGSDFGSLAVGPDGSVYVVECGGPIVGCVLHRLGADGRELPGWPFWISASSACFPDVPCVTFLVVGSDRTAYVTSWRQSQDHTQIFAIDAAGELRPGWPIAVPERYGWFSEPQLGPDGTLFISTYPDGGDTKASLAAYGPDGDLRPGWPVPLEGGYTLGPQGTVVVSWGIDNVGELCTEFRRTVFAVLGPDGRTLHGWPRGSKGTASGPVVGADGTVYYVSALGNVYAHDQAGEVKAGWPVSVPGVFPGCGRYGPFLGPDGTVLVLGDEVVAISPNGSAWRYRPDGALGGSSCDTDGANRPAPAFGSDGTTYISAFDSTEVGENIDIVALDRKGHVKPGWPYQLPIDGRSSDVASLDVSPDGRLYVTYGACGSDAVATLVALDPDGSVSE